MGDKEKLVAAAIAFKANKTKVEQNSNIVQTSRLNKVKSALQALKIRVEGLTSKLVFKLNNKIVTVTLLNKINTNCPYLKISPFDLEISAKCDLDVFNCKDIKYCIKDLKSNKIDECVDEDKAIFLVIQYLKQYLVI